MTKYSFGSKNQPCISSAEEILGNLQPSNRFSQVEIDLNQVFDLAKIKTEHVRFPALDFQELQSEIKLLRIRNSVLDEDGFVRIGQATRLGNDFVQVCNN